MSISPPHDGAHWRYAKGCRCDPCRKAHAKYETKARALREKERKGLLVRKRQIVDVSEVRQHLHFLASHNVNARSIGNATGISYTTIYEIGWGSRKSCTKKVANKILGLGVKTFYKHQMFDSKQVRQMLDEMKATGLKKYEIGLLLGYKGGHFNIYDKMQMRNYKKFVELHSKICSEKAAQ